MTDYDAGDRYCVSGTVAVLVAKAEKVAAPPTVGSFEKCEQRAIDERGSTGRWSY